MARGVGVWRAAVVWRVAGYGARRGMARGVVWRVAWYGARRGMAHGVVWRTVWYAKGRGRDHSAEGIVVCWKC